MRYLPINSLRDNNTLFVRSFIILLLTCITVRINLCFSSTSIPSSLRLLSLDGHFNFDDVDHAARDFGNRFRFRPSAVLHPKSVSDIANTIKHIWQMGPHSEIKVAARGHGHSLQGQSQAHRGIVIHMESLQGPKMQVHVGNLPHVDVSGGELWINILHESLKYGLAPKSWTDYLHLTVGGTLSNAGISGQAFRHGPQISNVHQLMSTLDHMPCNFFGFHSLGAPFKKVPLSQCSWRTWSVWHHYTGKNITGTSTLAAKP